VSAAATAGEWLSVSLPKRPPRRGGPQDFSSAERGDRANDKPLGPCDAAQKAIVEMAPQGGPLLPTGSRKDIRQNFHRRWKG